MNLYIYWYFIVYELYKNFNRDKHFSIFATAFFSVFIGFIIVGIVGVTLSFLNIKGVVLSAKGAVIVGSPALIGNFIFFNHKKRQIRLYEVFKKNRSNKKDILSVLMTIISIIMFVVAARMNM
jgi:hypothetical protein